MASCAVCGSRVLSLVGARPRRYCSQRCIAKAQRARSKARPQNGRAAERPAYCEACGKPGRICFDHCHATGRFRGWLCNGCNTALGYVMDSPETLLALAAYLRRSREGAA